jgi:hypothetical protein
MKIKVFSNIDYSILKSYCAYSSSGRICAKFPTYVEELLAVLSNCELDESKVVFNLNSTFVKCLKNKLILTIKQNDYFSNIYD